MLSHDVVASDIGSHDGTLDLTTTETTPYRQFSRIWHHDHEAPLLLIGVCIGITFISNMLFQMFTFEQKKDALAQENPERKIDALAIVAAMEKDAEEAVVGRESAVDADRADGPADPPTETHPLEPKCKWFNTDHEDYRSFVDLDENAELHPWLIGGMFCHMQSMVPCDYEALCPDGRGRDPFRGGPPEDHARREDPGRGQWLPVATPTSVQFDWIQVGSISDANGGVDMNRCWNWKDWKGGEIMDVLGDEHRQWILCCEMGNKEIP